MKLEGKVAIVTGGSRRDRRLHRPPLRAGGCRRRRGRQHQARPRRGGGGRDRGRRRQGRGVSGRYRRGGGLRAPGAGGDRGLRHGGHPGEQCRHLHAAPHRGGHRGELGRPARAQSQGRVLPDQGRRPHHEGQRRRQDHQYLVHRRLRRVPELQRLLRDEGRPHQHDQGAVSGACRRRHQRQRALARQHQDRHERRVPRGCGIRRAASGAHAGRDRPHGPGAAHRRCGLPRLRRFGLGPRRGPPGGQWLGPPGSGEGAPR